ncbi:MAG TPA: site-specific DNA-methyltransferase [Pseudolysinimonas sp.]|nr:site-specific DNA-methyltransferase [Pseudolysinimonas sp.]
MKGSSWDAAAWASAAAKLAIVHGDNLAVTRTLPDECARLIYLDPPFNTGRTQRLQTITTVRADGGARTGFKGHSYETVKGALSRYDDRFDDYWAFLEPRLTEAWRLLDEQGTLYLHLDYREAHYAKVALDALFGRECFLNELIWAYDYGAKSTRRWPAKHDTILVYVKHPERYLFDSTAVDREPYMAPGLVTPEKVARGKLPTDVWWHTIVSTNGAERTGYPTQKPLGILRRIVQASSAPGDLVLDFFAGSGTTGAAAVDLGRRALLVDESADAVAVMRERLSTATVYTL